MAEGLIWARQGEAVQSNTHKSGTALVILSILIEIWHCEEKGTLLQDWFIIKCVFVECHEEGNEPWSLRAVRKDYERFAGEVRGP
jgi:hypothetical protein